MSDTTNLLEHLAGSGWFAKHGEVALTSGLTFCLANDAQAAEAFVRLVRRRTSATVPAPVRWQAESRESDATRVDVAGFVETTTHQQVPVIVVEAKIGAGFAGDQVSTYVKAQQRRLGEAGLASGATVVLVPESRVQMCREELADELVSLDAIPRDQLWVVDGAAQIFIAVISWDESLTKCIAAGGPKSADLDQLLGACRALKGADVRALSEADLAGAWTQREADLMLIIDRVTRGVTSTLVTKPFPWRPNPAYGMAGGSRYVISDDGHALAVGMRADRADPPLWVRWHRETPDLAQVQPRLESAGRSAQEHDGHLWVPLVIHPDTGAATRQIDSLVAQVVDLFKISSAWNDVT